nr:unnamed protein product [Callosobruchus analis]
MDLDEDEACKVPFKLSFAKKCMPGKSNIEIGKPLLLPPIVNEKFYIKREADSDFIKEKTEEYLKKLVVLGPKEKYDKPLSENQRYGWYQARLTTANWDDRNLYHHKHMDVIVKEQMMSYQKIINR